MALFGPSQFADWLDLDLELASKAASGLNRKYAEREVRRLISDTDYDDIASSKSEGDDKWDRVAQAEALFAFSSYIGNRGGIRLSQKGGLVRDLGIVNQQQTIRQLLTQGQIEQVQDRLESQAKELLGDLISSDAYVWGV